MKKNRRRFQDIISICGYTGVVSSLDCGAVALREMPHCRSSVNGYEENAASLGSSWSFGKVSKKTECFDTEHARVEERAACIEHAACVLIGSCL